MPIDKLLLTTSRFQVFDRTTTTDGKTHSRQVIVHPGAVTILPIFDDGRVCLIRNYRAAVNQTLIELPAGTLEPGEEPLRTAEREIEEETGYRAAEIEFLCSFWMSPGILSERMHLFVARGLTETRQSLDAGETIEPLIVSWDEALAMTADGRIQDAKSLVGLLYYERFRKAGA